MAHRYGRLITKGSVLRANRSLFPRAISTDDNNSSQLLSKFPCDLAFITPCRCWRLQKRTLLNPDDRVVKGSLDSVTGAPEKCNELYEQDLSIGEVNISSDGLLHPNGACESSCNSKYPRFVYWSEKF